MIYYLLTPFLALITQLWLECVYKAWGSRLMYRDFRYACLAALAVSAIIIPTIMFAIFIAEGGLTGGYPTTPHTGNHWLISSKSLLLRYIFELEHLVMLAGILIATIILTFMHADDLRGGDQVIATLIPIIPMITVYCILYI